MKTKLILFLFLLSIHIFSQHEADNWIFGVNAGVNFQTGNPTNISSSLIPMNSMEGCAAISDVNGNLLFYVGAPNQYASNLTVWIPYDSDNNGIHDIMPGGNNLIGDVSATQAAIIVPKPDDDTVYYIFTVDKYYGYTPENNRGLNYYTVDMTLNSGRGGISGGVVNLLKYSAEKITAVKSNDCKSIWVLSYSSNDANGTNVASNAFHAFKVTNTGVDPNSILSNSGLSGMVDGRGYMKVSPDGKKLAMAQTPNQEVLLFDFNDATGLVSNGIRLNFPKYDNTYGLEFSKDSKRLYVTTYNSHGDDSELPNDSFLYQFDLEAAQPENSAVVIDAVYDNLYRTALQLAPDGKIYRTMPQYWGVAGGSQFLSVINDPENLGPSCNYILNVVDLGIGRSHQGLPPFIQSLFTDNLDIIHQVNLNTNDLNICIGDTYTIYADDTNYPAGTTYSWTLNGNPISETSNSITLNYTGTYNNGLFEVTITFPDSNCPQKGSANVSFFTRPKANPVDDWMVCDTDNNGFFNFDLASLNPTVLGSQSASNFTVSYHLSQVHADADTNPISLNYTNLTAYLAQTIFIRIENNACTTCFDTTSFIIDVADTPTAHTVPNIESCDNAMDGDDTNGLLSFDLTLQNAGILGTQSATQYQITYHLSQSDADNDVNPLSSPHINTLSPHAQPIFARIENIDNTFCFDTTSFNLIVHPLPVITATPVSLEQCDDDIDGYAPFNLFESTQLISTAYQNETFIFYLSQADALAHSNPIPNPTNYINPNQPTSTVWAEVSTIHGCTRVKEVTLTVATTQIPSNFLLQYEDCDNLLIDNNDTNGVIPFDLTAANAQIEALFPNPQNLTITYYENMIDALAEQNAITDLSNYQNINYPYHQFITVRVDSEDYNACLGLGEHIELTVYPLPSFPSNVSDYVACSSSDQYAFDLTSKDTEILNGQTDVSITYHVNANDAHSGNHPLSLPFTNYANPQPIYVRMVNTVTGCVNAYGSFNLQVLPKPINENTTNYEICDDAIADGITTFDLNTKRSEILGTQTDVSVSFYTNSTDASNGTNQLSSPYTNLTNPETIYFRMENVVSHCTTFDTFDLIVNPLPTATPPTSLEVCDPDSDGFHVFNLHLKDSEIAGALVGQVNVTYHETLTDAQLGTTDIPDFGAYYNIDAWNQIIYARVENSTIGCFDTTTLELIVNPTPQINFTPDDLEICDDNYDGFRQIDLTAHIPEILGGVPLSNVQVSFHHSQADASAEVNRIINDTAYTNLSNPETIWVRVEYPATNCATIVSFDLIIHPLPILTTPTPLSLCDNDDDGEDNNGYVQTFILTDKDVEILNGQTGIVSYHFTQAEAQNGTNPISSPFTNTFATVQTLWVRVQNIATGCFALTTLDVRVNPLPTPVVPEPLKACDRDGDGFASFELDAALIFEIQNGENGTAITFYETYQDAEDSVNPLATPYTSISTADNSQIIYARDTYTATGCFRIVEVLLIAQPTPQLTDPTDYEVCDDDYDGFFAFDLNLKTEEILGNIDPASVIVSYHLSQSDADSGSHAIDINQLYTNATNPQTLYVRVESVANGCFNTVSLQLIVNPLPTTIVPTPLEMCDGSSNDETATFDLESKVTEILHGQTGMIVYFFETLAQAQTNNPNDWLESPYQNTSNPQTIFVRIQNLNTGCFAITTLDLRVLPSPNVNYTPDPLELCDNNSDGDATNGFIQSFDLSNAIPDITNNQANVSVAFYLDAALTTLITPLFPFTNTVAHHQTVYAVVTDNASPLSCTAVVPLELIVNPLPVLTNLTNYLFCETDNNNVYLADLHEIDIHLLANATDLPNVTITYHLTAADAATGNNPLPSPRILHDTDVLYAHVAFTVTGCVAASGPITFTIEQEPRVVTPPTWMLCDDATDTNNANGIGVSFDLTTQNSLILDGQTGMSVSYYLSQADAELSQNALASPFANTSNPQTIFVRVENNTTHCYNFTSFEIGVNDPPHYTLDPLAIYCLNEGSIFLEPATDGDTYTYEWTLGGTVVGNNAILEVSDGGTYTLTVSTAEGCSESQNVVVQESQESLLTEEDLVFTYFENNNTLTIPTGTQYGLGNYLYSIDGSPFTSQVQYPDINGGSHTLVITDQNGCKTHTITFIILDYMRFFTPNGDGYNDTWNLLGGNTQPGAEIYIFDRHGKLLAKIDPMGAGWDGKYNGQPMPSTDYWFSIELTDGTVQKGHFSLVRR